MTTLAINGIEINSGLLRPLATREKIDTGHGGRYGPTQNFKRRFGNLVWLCTAIVFSRQDHIGLEQYQLQYHMMPM